MEEAVAGPISRTRVNLSDDQEQRARRERHERSPAGHFADAILLRRRGALAAAVAPGNFHDGEPRDIAHISGPISA
jgi:hypothetical protein